MSEILGSVPPPNGVQSLLRDALSHYAAADVFSQLDVPPFANSALDGFAVLAADTECAEAENPVKLRVIGTAPAGLPFAGVVGVGTAVEIMTGAPIPAGATGIARVEITRRLSPEWVEILQPVKPGLGVRGAGADTKRGDLLIEVGDLFTPARIGLMASCGISEVLAFRKPRIALCTGGDEIIPHDSAHPLASGQIYDSNSPMLETLLSTWGFPSDLLGRMPDTLSGVKAILERGMAYDVLVTTGGVSMGRLDYVRPALKELGFSEKFWKLNQQPGGPISYGLLGKTMVFGLPGNPVSAYFCAELYLRAALLNFSGARNHLHPEIEVVVGERLTKEHRKTAFLRGVLKGPKNRLSAVRNGPQDSNLIRSLCEADGYIVFPSESSLLEAGHKAKFILTKPAKLAEILSEEHKEGST
ncbi:MAG: molybdopterin molybdotransferase MoeA [Candidatus Sumerlaeaceae bacterium]|nr:molybdopterin molybdotransferase MoeA [Candidatus Sumerlaeaceae bacterium]